MRLDPYGNPLHVRMHYKHGAYWYVTGGKWHKLGRSYREAMPNYAAWLAPTGGMQKLVADVYDWQKRRIGKPKPVGITERTYNQYCTVRERIDTAFADFGPDQVKTHHITTFLDFHFEDSPAVGNLTLTMLRTIFGRAVRWGLCEYNPAKECEWFTVAKRDRLLTDEELRGIRAEAPDWLKLVIDMCYLTAQRIGDVLLIKQSDISAEGVTFRQQKSLKRLEVGMTSTLSDVIGEVRRLNSVAGVYLFARSATLPLHYDKVKYHWNKAVEASGVEDARLHDIRAKALTDADAEGIDAQKLAGHASRAMTERYLRALRIDRVTSPGNVASFRQV